MEIYVGTGSDFSCRTVSDNFSMYDSLTMGSKVVLHLIEHCLRKGYHVVMDNFFTSPELFEILLQYNTHAYGTIRSNRRLLPNDIRQEILRKGNSLAYERNGMIFTKWSDPQKKTAKVVTTLSTIHCHEMKNTGKVSRRSGSPILKPSVIIDYSKNMGSVDSVSQIVHPYKITRKGRKWFRKVFEMCCEMMALNASVIRQLGETRNHFWTFCCS